MVVTDDQQAAVIRFQIPGLPPELQGVSVKELVKAIGQLLVSFCYLGLSKGLITLLFIQ